MSNPYPKSLQQVINTMYKKSVHDYETDCWLWQGATTKGHGLISYKGKLEYVHRVSFLYFVGPILDQVRHTCDVRNCWNPDHLLPGSNQDNINDKIERGRELVGSAHPNSKLTEEQAKEIKYSRLSQVYFIAKYKISSATISRIKTGKIWRHI